MNIFIYLEIPCVLSEVSYCIFSDLLSRQDTSDNTHSIQNRNNNPENNLVYGKYPKLKWGSRWE